MLGWVSQVGDRASPFVGSAAAKVETELFKPRCKFVARRIESRQLPHCVARFGRVDLADTGDERHDEVRPANGGRNGLNHPDWHRCQRGDKNVLLKQFAVKWEERLCILPEFEV